jgi:hypothetical protein
MLLLLIFIILVSIISEGVRLSQLDAEAGRAAADQVVLSTVDGLHTIIVCSIMLQRVSSG